MNSPWDQQEHPWFLLRLDLAVFAAGLLTHDRLWDTVKLIKLLPQGRGLSFTNSEVGST